MCKKIKAAVQNLNADIVRALVLPVPPLEVQHEIVHILDSFTLLTVELKTKLTAELTARKKQYEFYRDKLLSVKKDIPIVKLGDIATEFYRGSSIKRDEVTDTGIPCVRYGEIYTTYNTWFDKCVSYTKLDFVKSPKYFENGDILFAITGESVENIAKSVVYIGHEKCLAGGDIIMAVTSENVEDVCSCTAWLGDEDVAVSGHTAIISHNQNAKFLSYYFHSSDFFAQKKKLAHGTKVIEVTPNKLNDIIIMLPVIEKQERIVSILDRFDTLCNDLSAGLPAEIEARQKQYEYYRDKLLSFKELPK